MENIILSCVDCGVINCDKQNCKYPSFCLTKKLNKEIESEAMHKYNDEDNKNIMISAVEVEYEGYNALTRVEETIKFAKKLGVKKIGIATCVGLIRESKILSKILRKHDFEVYGVGCKVGAILKTTVGIDEKCNEVGKNMCNPILQAEILNKENTDLNIVMGLCVGHDSLFYKHSNAIVTTLVVKDRVMGHNPVAALYTSNSYCKKLYDIE